MYVPKPTVSFAGTLQPADRLLRMVLMMVNLFTLIKYAFGMEATRNITPGMEPKKDATGWNKLDIEKCISQPVVYLFL